MPPALQSHEREANSGFSDRRGVPYGCYSTLSVHEVDASGTPLFPPIAQQHPGCFGREFPQWWTTSWDIPVPEEFMVLFTFHPHDGPGVCFGYPNTAPGGPPPCADCLPTTRLTRSFVWPEGDITGPGEPFRPPWASSDLELMVRCKVTPMPVAVEAMGWTGIKALYR